MQKERGYNGAGETRSLRHTRDWAPGMPGATALGSASVFGAGWKSRGLDVTV